MSLSMSSEPAMSGFSRLLLQLLLKAGLVPVSEMRASTIEARPCCAVYGSAGATAVLLYTYPFFITNTGRSMT